MRRLFALFILSVFLTFTFSQMLIVANYVVNMDYIAEYLCENQDKPELECNGKCHLKKELQKDEERKSSENRVQYEVMLVLNWDKPISIVKTVPEEEEKSWYNYVNYITEGSKKGIFHPPKCIVNI